MFLCAFRPRGEPLTRGELLGGVLPGDPSLTAIFDGPFAALAANSGVSAGRPRLARWRRLIGAGDVRLDNPVDVAAIAGVDMQRVGSELELVLAAIDCAGEACIAQILGDFAFVVWDPHAHKLVAARDAFGVKPLYATTVGELVMFASHVGPLRGDNEVDLDFVAGFLNGAAGYGNRTIWRGIESVTPGTTLRYRGTVGSSTTFWRASDFMPAADSDEASDCRQFRALLATAVRARVRPGEQVWAQLSGGLDSSAVVAVAAADCGARLGGTITIVDSLGEGDERRYSGAVVERYKLRNEQVHDYWAWQDDGEPPPPSSQPTPMYPFFARERRMAQVVRSNGAGVLLTGIGADHYLYGTLDYITDLASAGRLGSALSELTSWSVTTRQSFWRLGREYLINPFLPHALHQAACAPKWLSPGLQECAIGQDPGLQHRVSSKFAGSVVAALRALPSWIDSEAFGPGVEMRHPFLYRPLVELCLRLPPRQRIRPQGTKWILRQALRDLLPDVVRNRTTKGGIDARILWSLQHERRRVDQMLDDPILGQFGCIDVVRLRRAVDDARSGIPINNVQLFSALSLETWLSVHAGRWTEIKAFKAA